MIVSLIAFACTTPAKLPHIDRIDPWEYYLGSMPNGLTGEEKPPPEFIRLVGAGFDRNSRVISNGHAIRFQSLDTHTLVLRLSEVMKGARTFASREIGSTSVLTVRNPHRRRSNRVEFRMYRTIVGG